MGKRAVPNIKAWKVGSGWAPKRIEKFGAPVIDGAASIKTKAIAKIEEETPK